MNKNKQNLILLAVSMSVFAASLYFYLNFKDNYSVFVISFVFLIVSFLLSVYLIFFALKTVSRVLRVIKKLVLKFTEYIVKIYEIFADSSAHKIYVKGKDTVKTGYFRADNSRKNKVRIKPPKPKDIKTPSDKVRYVYITYVRKKIKEPPASYTARTVLGNIGGEGSELLCVAYEPVRYGNTVPDEKTCEDLLKLI